MVTVATRKSITITMLVDMVFPPPPHTHGGRISDKSGGVPAPQASPGQWEGLHVTYTTTTDKQDGSLCVFSCPSPSPLPLISSPRTLLFLLHTHTVAGKGFVCNSGVLGMVWGWVEKTDPTCQRQGLLESLSRVLKAAGAPYLVSEKPHPAV